MANGFRVYAIHCRYSFMLFLFSFFFSCLLAFRSSSSSPFGFSGRFLCGCRRANIFPFVWFWFEEINIFFFFLGFSFWAGLICAPEQLICGRLSCWYIRNAFSCLEEFWWNGHAAFGIGHRLDRWVNRIGVFSFHWMGKSPLRAIERQNFCRKRILW